MSVCFFFFFFNDTATTEIYTYLHTLSLHDALPISGGHHVDGHQHAAFTKGRGDAGAWSEDAITEIGVAGRESDDEATKNPGIARNIMGVLLVHRMVGEDERSEEHTSELQSLMRISYAVFCLKKKKTKI